jgi:hypothetical protein
MLSGRALRVLNPEFCVGNVPANVEGAISWFIAGLHAIHPPVALMCNWLGIEMLAPDVKRPVMCPNRGCEKEIGKCPHCHNPTIEPKATKSVVDYLTKQCGVNKKDAKELYQGRNDVAHGRVKLDEAGLLRAIPMVNRTRTLLLDGIKRALSWPKESMPTIEDAVLNSPIGIMPTEPRQAPFSRDFPINAGGWKDYKLEVAGKTYRGIRALAGMLHDLGV